MIIIEFETETNVVESYRSRFSLKNNHFSSRSVHSFHIVKNIQFYKLNSKIKIKNKTQNITKRKQVKNYCEFHRRSFAFIHNFATILAFPSQLFGILQPEYEISPHDYPTWRFRPSQYTVEDRTLKFK